MLSIVVSSIVVCDPVGLRVVSTIEVAVLLEDRATEVETRAEKEEPEVG